MKLKSLPTTTKSTWRENRPSHLDVNVSHLFVSLLLSMRKQHLRNISAQKPYKYANDRGNHSGTRGKGREMDFLCCTYLEHAEKTNEATLQTSSSRETKVKEKVNILPQWRIWICQMEIRTVKIEGEEKYLQPECQNYFRVCVRAQFGFQIGLIFKATTRKEMTGWGRDRESYKTWESVLRKNKCKVHFYAVYKRHDTEIREKEIGRDRRRKGGTEKEREIRKGKQTIASTKPAT